MALPNCDCVSCRTAVSAPVPTFPGIGQSALLNREYVDRRRRYRDLHPHRRMMGGPDE